MRSLKINRKFCQALIDYSAYLTSDLTEDDHVKALVLASGQGNRLGRLTKRKPKGLLCVAGVPLLGRILRGLKKAGVQEIWIAVGYKADMIREQVGEDYAQLNVKFIKAQHWKKGNLYSLLAAQGIFQQNFLLCMCDYIFDQQIPKTLISNKSEKADRKRVLEFFLRA